MLPIVLIVVALVGLVSLFLWRSKHASSPPPAPVAASNHKSVRSFNYGPTPVVPAPPVVPAAPAATADVLEQFMPAEDSRSKGQARVEVAAPEIKPQEEVVAPAPVVVAKEPVAVTAAKEPVAPAAAVSALDMLGDAELPAPKPVAPEPSSDEAEPDPSLFYNPFTRVAPTAIDKANQLTAQELRKRQRAAIQSRATGQKAALSTLYKQD